MSGNALWRTAHLAHHAPAQALGRRVLNARRRQSPRHPLEGGYVLAACGTALHVRAEVPRLVELERTEGIGRRVAAPGAATRHLIAGAHSAILAASPSAKRILLRPRRIRPFTVPAGSFSISAIWLWLKPPK